MAELLCEIHSRNENWRQDIAALMGDLQQVKRLIRTGADVNARAGSPGQTPLQSAAERGHLNVVKLLLDSGADVNARSRCGRTALWAARCYGRKEVAEFLRSQGAKE